MKTGKNRETKTYQRRNRSKKPNNYIRDELRIQLIDLIIRSNSISLSADKLSINRSTAKSIWYNFNKTGRIKRTSCNLIITPHESNDRFKENLSLISENSSKNNQAFSEHSKPPIALENDLAQIIEKYDLPLQVNNKVQDIC